MTTFNSTLIRGVDTFASAAEPLLAHHSLPYADVELDAAVYAVTFALGAPPFNSTCPLATLNLVTQAVDPDEVFLSPATLRVTRITAPWSPSTVTWDNLPSTAGGETVDAVLALGVGETDWSIDVTDLVAPVVAGAPWYGFLVERVDAQGAISIATFDADDPTLSLELTLVVPAKRATGLIPNSGLAVGTRWPVVEVEGIGITKMQVQLSADGLQDADDEFETVEYDTGPIDTTRGKVDLLAAGYAGLPTLGTLRYLIARVMIDGDWTKWTDVESTHFVAQPDFQIIIPADDGTLTDPSPTVACSYAGVMTRYRVSVARKDQKDVALWDTKDQTGEVTSIEIPKHTLKDNRTTYVLTWETEDDVARIDTQGSPKRQRRTHQFRFVKDSIVQPPDGVRVWQDGADPAVIVDITRGAAPDSFGIIRDGEIIESDLVPGDLLILDPDGEVEEIYRWRDYAASGYEAHQYEPFAVINGRSSLDNPTGIITTRPAGIWLTDIPRQLQLFLAKDQTTQSTVDGAAEYQMLGNEDTIRDVWTLQNPSGHIDAMTIDGFGHTAMHWREVARRMKQRPSSVLLLRIGSTAKYVRIGNVNIERYPNAPESRKVSFDWWQVGDDVFTDLLDGETIDDPVIEAVMYGFEEGVAGAQIQVYDPEAETGSPGVVHKQSTPKYGVGLHGDLGYDGDDGSTLTYELPNSFGTTFRFYMRHDSTTAPVRQTVMTIQDEDETDLVKFKVGTNGAPSITKSDVTVVKDDNVNIPYGTATSDWYRVDGAVGWNADGTLSLVLRITLNAESTEYDSEMRCPPIPVDTRPKLLQIGNLGGLTKVRADSVAFLEDTSRWIEPVLPLDGGTGAEPSHTFVGAATPTAALIRAVYPDEAAGATVGAIVSTSDTLSSPITVPTTVVDATDLVAQMEATGLTADTRYYGKLTVAAAPVGRLFRFKTSPALTGSWTRKIALLSCQHNAGGSLTQVAWQDIYAWDPDDIWHLGDWGYWGQGIGSDESYTKDIRQYTESMKKLTQMRAVVEACSMQVIMISDHELHHNGDSWIGGDDEDTLGCLHSVRQLVAHQRLMPIRTWWDTRNPRLHRGHHFDMGTKVRIHVLDMRTPERNLSNDPETPAKQLWGAAQEASFFAALDTSKVNLIVCETAWWINTGGLRAHDKPAAYPNAQQRMIDKLTGTGAYAGGPVYKVAWIGGDRHRTSYKASNEFGGPQYIGSGTEKNALALQDGELVDWTSTIPDTSADDDKFPCCTWMQLTLAYNSGTGKVTLDGVGRHVPDTTIPVEDWELEDIDTAHDEWTP